MSYEKQTWATGDIITAEKLNHMEDGIVGAEGTRIPTCAVTYKFAEGVVDPQITFNGMAISPVAYALNPEEPYGIASQFTLNMNPEGTVVKCLYHVIDNVWSCVAPTGIYTVDSTEDAVNYDDGDIIDPSKDSSITLILSSK